jgi:hypothetical protein
MEGSAHTRPPPPPRRTHHLVVRVSGPDAHDIGQVDQAGRVGPAVERQVVEVQVLVAGRDDGQDALCGEGLGKWGGEVGEEERG